ncbi:MAG: hypothetical protein ACR2RA_19945 [Geminicoccaceae bacterium]
MTDKATIAGGSAQRRPANGVQALRQGHWTALLRSVLSGTRLLDRVVRSLFKRAIDRIPLWRSTTSSLLLKPMQALMLVGIRCAGAGGGGPGH